MICRGCRHFLIFAKRLRMKNLFLYLILLSVLLFTSCSPARKAARSTPSPGPATDYAREYIIKYGNLAVSEMKRSGIPASITLAQGMLESNYGRSRLATQANNHFGIKCHSDWSGGRIYHDDNRRNECFRSYNSPEESYRDHSDFLVNGSRYSDLFSLKATDYKGWAHGLKKAGYATDPKYPDLLIRKIEEYGLWAYDSGSASPIVSQLSSGSPLVRSDTAPAPAVSTPAKTTVTPQPAVKGSGTQVQQVSDKQASVRDEEEPVKVISITTGEKTLENNGVEYIIIGEGDTYESLAERHQLLMWEISRYNELTAGAPLVPGQVLYLQPKRARAAQGLSVHTAEAGETMYSISQRYAVKLSSLYKMNLMDEGTECRPGQKIRLR